ncbi:MAG: adenosylhomocysteinase, partial [Thermoplasmata archaeon]
MASKLDGEQKIYWAESRMGIISSIRERFRIEKPLKGIRVGMALHLEAKTAVLAKVLKEGGADVYITSCNPLTTDDDVALKLSEEMKVFGKRGQTKTEYYESLNKVLDANPHIIID